ncbi:MAG: N-acetylmuramoyl-L-alanine amidase [Proteobacteria bacterium]|nr:N-acetylmuramoyl-L-alanine amidase [Pseudomonadota bacterium]MBU1639265.1 N-acetylmuramoyl-L-alanine amidase [Pseudomonadota bacterium]
MKGACLHRKTGRSLVAVGLVLVALLVVLIPVRALAAVSDLADKRYRQAASYYNNSCAFYVQALDRSQWQECLRLFQKALDASPDNKEVAPKSLFMMAKIYSKAYEQFGMREDLKASAAYYEKLTFTFPEDSLADDAMVALGKILLGNKEGSEVVDKERLLGKALAVYGPEPGTGEDTTDFLLNRLKEHASERRGEEPEPTETIVNSIRPASHAAHITRPVRFWSNKNYTRVVIETSAPVRFKENVLKANGTLPPRLYVDLFDCRIPSTYQNPVTIQDGLLKRSRAAQFDPSTSRVVIDLETLAQYKIFSLQEPFRVVIDITGTLETPTVAVKPRQPWDPDKEFTLAEQLGLGVKTIVIDAGHGGKDPGAVGRGGVLEKDVVLKVALMTRDALRKKGYKVVLTRNNDTFLPLEERTAIANTENADLFLSIHANSAPNRRAKGLETYYLSLATTNEEKQAAALENAVSSKQLSELQNILSDIMKNSKIDESRKFAGTVQSSMALGMKKRYKNVKDLGVKKAPFFVLIGAQMPSVLAEIAFLSNKEEEKLLRSDSYLMALATEIANGVEMYSRSLQ